MLTSFVLSMALAAPVPPATPPVPSGPAPRVMELKANADGKVMVTVTRTEAQKIQIAQAGPNGAQVVTREVQIPKIATVELGEVKDLKITTADGKKVEVDEAVKKLKEGAVVVVSADGKAVSPKFLKAFKDDVLVLAAAELAASQGVPALPPPPLRPGANILPVPAQPGVIQIQIAPAAPVPAPAPAPEK